MRFIFLLFFIVPIICQSDFEEYKKKQKNEFEESKDDFSKFEEYNIAQQVAYNKSFDSLYEDAIRKDKEAFEDYKREIEELWKIFQESTNKSYVEYSENKTEKVVIDFENGKVEVEVLVDANENSFEKGKEKLERATKSIVKIKDNQGKSILENQIVNSENVNITKKNINEEVKLLVKKDSIKVKKDYKGADNKKRVKYKIVIPLKKNHLAVRARKFEELVYKNAERFDLEPALIFAIIETESAFNPKAKSHVPAYGLMQLVPKSGARDAYLYIYKKDIFLKKNYLYKPINNIELGCAYLAKIRYVYFSGIKNDEKAFICTIPAYNTGIGNVAKTLTGTTKLNKASRVANNMSEKELYKKLVNDLQYKEARDYLKRVIDKKKKYES